jgi:hypothetical protein
MNKIAWMPEEDLQTLGAVWVSLGETLTRGKWIATLELRVEQMILNEDEPILALGDLVRRLEDDGLLYGPFPFRPGTEKELEEDLWRHMPHLISENPAILDWLGWVELPKEPVAHNNPDAEELFQADDLWGWLSSLESLL